MTGAGLEKFSNPTQAESQPKNSSSAPGQFEIDYNRLIDYTSISRDLMQSKIAT